MNGFSTLPLGEKIMQIRKSKGLSMENMAHAIKKSQPFISRFERGEADCSAEELESIKKFLEIENAPLFEHEQELFRNRIIMCYKLPHAEWHGGAKAMFDELSVITQLPFEHSLSVMYLMLVASFHLTDGLLEANKEDMYEQKAPAEVDELLAQAEPLLDNASDEALYFYHFVKARLYYVREDDANALKHYLVASNTNCEFAKKDELYANIGAAYFFAGKLSKAIIYLELAKADYKGNVTDINWVYQNFTIAICYMCMSDYDKAKDLLNKSLFQAKSIAEGEQIEFEITITIGILCQLTKEYEQSIGYFDQALIHKARHRHIACLAYKADSLRHLKKFEKCQEVLAQGRALVKEDGTGAIYIDTISHLLNLGDNGSINYIENTAIPFFRATEVRDRYYAIYLCNELETHYKKKRTHTKANAIATVARDIYKDMYEGDIKF